MPTSVEEGKDWTLDKIKSLPHDYVLDIGPGAGRYADLLRDTGAVVDAVEVWEPYVAQFGLTSKYNHVYVTDFLEFATDTRYDIVIMGDVLEHFEESDALKALDLARSIGKYVIISTPTVDWPQGPYEGNHFESHLSQFYWEDLIKFPGYLDGKNFKEVGVVLLEGTSD